MGEVSDERDEHATCRGCGMRLIGRPYWAGGSAYLPGPKMERAKVNHYGGFVCSRTCDFNSSLRLEKSMPGHDHRQTRLGCYAAESLERNWPNA